MASINLKYKIVTVLPEAKTPYTVYMVANTGAPTQAKFCVTNAAGDVVINSVSGYDVAQAIAAIPAPSTNWADIVGKPAVIAAGADAAAARAAIGAGDLMSTGGTLTGDLKSTVPDNFRMRHPSYGTFWRNDGQTLYLMKTAFNNPDGGWDATRPLMLDLATGILNINGNANTANTAANVSGIVPIANGGTGYTTSRDAYVGNKLNRQQHLNGSQTTYYLTAGTEYSVYSPTQNPVFVGVLPETPVVGDEIVFFNGWGTWDTGRFSVMRGSPNHSINNQTDSILFDTNDVRLVRFTYIWSNIWIVSLE